MAHPHSPKLRRPRTLRDPSRVAAPAPKALALALSAAMLVPAAAFAQAKPDEKAKETELPQVKVQATAIDPNPNAQPDVPYKAATSGDTRHTRPLAETPATIQVLTKTMIDESGQTDLRAILNAQPGITIGTGENGNQFGDRYIIRGQEARSDVFVDSLRDPGMTTRESFAIEQLEISKGPNSSFAGRGTAGGAVNAITKQATLDYDFARISTGFGSDQYLRLTADVNKAITDQFVIRANLLYAYEEVPDREPADRKREGVALAGLYEVNGDLSIGMDYYGFRGKDKPDLGTYLEGTVPDRKPREGIPVYLQEPDFLESDVDTFSARVKWKMAPQVSLTNLTRYGTSDNGYVVTGARSATGYAGTGSGSPYTTGTLSTHNGWQEVDYFANQTNVLFTQPLFGKKNEFILSVEYTDHSVLKGTWSIQNPGAFNCRTQANGTANNTWCTTNPDGSTMNGINTMLDRQIARGSWNGDWQIKTWGVAAMDTMDLTDRITVFGGLRLDSYDFDLGTRNNAGVEARYDASDTLTNGHLGVTYKFATDAIVYASYATAEDINGGESDVGTSSGYGGAVIYDGQIAGAKPEKSENWELGMKWDFLDHRLLLTAAAFQTTKKDVMEGANYDAVGTFNTGKSRVKGVEFGLVGAITEQLTVQAGAAFMESEVLASATASNIGNPLSNFAEKSAFVQAKYQILPSLGIGGTVTYESDKCAGQPDTGAGFNTDGLCTQPVPSYTKADLFATYRFNQNLDLRFNVLNVTDKAYYLAAYRSGAFVYMGDARAYRLTLNYEF